MCIDNALAVKKIGNPTNERYVKKSYIIHIHSCAVLLRHLYSKLRIYLSFAKIHNCIVLSVLCNVLTVNFARYSLKCNITLRPNKNLIPKSMRYFFL